MFPCITNQKIKLMKLLLLILPVIGMVGKIENVEKAISSKWKNIDDQIWIIGSYKSETTIAASSYLEYFHGKVTGRP